MELRNANLTSILAKQLEKKGFENKGYLDMQAGEIAFYAELHDVDWLYADSSEWLDLVISLLHWAWQRWLFTDELWYPTVIFFRFRWRNRSD